MGVRKYLIDLLIAMTLLQQSRVRNALGLEEIQKEGGKPFNI